MATSTSIDALALVGIVVLEGRQARGFYGEIIARTLAVRGSGHKRKTVNAKQLNERRTPTTIVL